MNEMNKTPDCNMHEALISLLYNEASPEESRQVAEHLKTCGRCAEGLTAFEGVRGVLQKWEVTELPEVRIVAKERVAGKRSMAALLRELLTISPLWAKALGGVAVAMVVLAVLGTKVSLGPNGFSMTLGWSRTSPVSTAQPQNDGNIDNIRAEIKTIVDSMIAESDRHQNEALKTQLISLESDLQNAHTSDLARLTARIQQQRELIRSLERDIDRREGMALSDMLFGQVDSRSNGTPDGD